MWRQINQESMTLDELRLLAAYRQMNEEQKEIWFGGMIASVPEVKSEKRLRLVFSTGSGRLPSSGSGGSGNVED